MDKNTEQVLKFVFPVLKFLQTRMPLSLSEKMLRRSVSRLRLGKGTTRTGVMANGVSCQWIIPDHSDTEKVLLYLHGGGFVFGLTPMHMKMCAYLSRKSGLRVLLADYRLVPEYPFPAALDDCSAVYEWLISQGYRAQNILLAGDSAGGNLALSLSVRLRDSGASLPAAIACLSPAVDLTNKEQPGKPVQDPLLSPEIIKFYSQAYVGQHNPGNPLISPIYASLHGLPPVLVHVGENELLRSDAELLVEKARAAGIDARLRVYPRMWHVWQLYLDLPEARQSLDEIAAFLNPKGG